MIIDNEKKTSIYSLNVVFFIGLSLLWAYMLIMHNVFEEWDGVAHYFSGVEFWKSGVYTGWASHFWPPVQPLIISIGDPLLIGKLVALLSGLLILITLYYFLDNFKLKNNQKATVLLLVFSSSFFITGFSVVENHAIEALFYISGLHFFILSESKNSKKLLILSAVLIAIAGLSRYTSYTLALAVGLYLVFQFNKHSIIKFIIFSAVFVIMSSAWWLPNYIMNGSPLSNWQYLNIGSKVHPDGVINWWWANQNNYNSLSDLILKHPKALAINFLKNISISAAIIAVDITSSIFTSLILASALVFVFIKEKSIYLFIKQHVFYILSALLYVMLCSTALVFPEALLPIIILVLVVLCSFLIKASEKNKPIIYIIYFIITTNALVTTKVVIDYTEYQSDRGGQLSDLDDVTKVINRYKKSDSVIASIHPARAYYANTNWIMFPLGDAKSICDIVNYNYSYKIKNFAPKHPVVNDKELEIDFLIITKDIVDLFEFINSDFKVDTYRCGNKLLEPVFNTAKTSVLRIIKD